MSREASRICSLQFLLGSVVAPFKKNKSHQKMPCKVSEKKLGNPVTQLWTSTVKRAVAGTAKDELVTSVRFGTENLVPFTLVSPGGFLLPQPGKNTPS